MMRKLKIKQVMVDGNWLIVKGIYEESEKFNHMDIVILPGSDNPFHIDKEQAFGDGTYELVLSTAVDQEETLRKVRHSLLSNPGYVSDVPSATKENVE